ARVKDRAEAALDPADARLPVHAEVGPGLDARAVVLDAIDRDAVAAEVERRLLERGAGERPHEARVPQVQRLVELRLDRLLGSDLHAQQPFRAEAVHPRAAEERAQVVRGLA